MKDLSIVIPAYKEDIHGIECLYQKLTLLGAEIIVVDDGNSMPDLEIPYHTYPANVGYGYAIKEGIKLSTRQFILTMDSDLQHTVSDAQKLYAVFKLSDNFDMVVSMRYGLKEKPHRWIGRKLLNFVASLIAGHYLIDLNSGMRIFRRELALGYSPILCDTFSFTTSLTMAMLTDGHKAFYFPITVQPRANGKSHVRLVKDGLVTLYYIVWVGLALRTRNIRRKIRTTLGLSTRS